jgi:hypothetical protein
MGKEFVMKNFRKRVFPLVPVLALILSLVISAIKAKTAAILTPCEEERIAEGASSRLQAVAGKTAPHPFAILVFNGVAIIDAVGSAEILSRLQQRSHPLIRSGSFAEPALLNTTTTKTLAAPPKVFKHVPTAEMAMLSQPLSTRCKRQIQRRGLRS